MGRLAPYERRVIELLRNSKDKRARKLAKKRVCPPTPLNDPIALCNNSTQVLELRPRPRT